MSTAGQFDPAHFGVYLLEALKDPQVQSAINKSIDHTKINDNVSIEVSKFIKILEDKIKKQAQEICDLKTKNVELESRCTELEQYSRKNTLKIEGIPEYPDENTFNTVLDVCGNLKLDPPMQLDDIDNCHRVGREGADGQPRGIIVKFSTYRARKRLFEARTRLADHNKRARNARSAGCSDEVFHEAGGQPTVVPAPEEPQSKPPEQHAGRRPGSRATNRSAPLSTSEPSPDAESDLSSTHNTPTDDPIFLPSKWPVYINEALCKSRGKLSFAARNLKRNNKINDTWTVDGRIKIRTIHNRIVNIDTMTELETYMWKLLYLFNQLWPHNHIMFYLPLV